MIRSTLLHAHNQQRCSGNQLHTANQHTGCRQHVEPDNPLMFTLDLNAPVLLRVHAAKGPAQLLGLNPASRCQLPAPLQHQQQRWTVLLTVWKEQQQKASSLIVIII
ncbi:hypothetical protein AMECASPLE_030246 [Ameca splendens]|uniref:Uncharacterized protein n=1 Tax=Ameca splendens TaxID=208324 RepID=A0ABV1ADD6_9TELE